MSFNPIRMHEEDIGAAVKGSKRKFQWHFELDGNSHHLVLECSLLTNKRRLSLNGESKYNGYKSLGRGFRYSFYMGKHIVAIENSGGKADVLIDN